MTGDQKGYSLAQLIAAMPLAVLVFGTLGLAMINFLVTYEETKLFIQLQDELFGAIETMRYGYTKKGVTDGEGLIGLLTASEVTIDLSRRSIRLEPVDLDPGLTYYSTFYLDDRDRLRVSGQYGINSYTDEAVFPSVDSRMGKENRFRILELEFTPEESLDGIVYLLGIRVRAQVRFRERSSDQSIEDDLRSNARTIEYETSVFIGNAGV